ncbi:MAG TPA: hypothetical protein VFB33_03835 [Candidatus Binataceae bacterium]|jgi:hypothetical protein|nr:hypothetical protein [Candidatus Binataceae bacterium]
MWRIGLLTVLVVVLTSGLGTIIVLLRIIPLDADARFPLAVTFSVMVLAGSIASGVLMRLAQRGS